MTRVVRSQKGWVALGKLVRKSLLILLLVEFVYVVLVNTALYLPVTQDLVNRIRPDKFQVSWERAWSWYPTRVHARGVNEKPGPVPGFNTTCGRS